MGGAANDQVKKLNNKLRFFKVLFKKFLESRGCGRTSILTCRSVTGVSAGLGLSQLVTGTGRVRYDNG